MAVPDGTQGHAVPRFPPGKPDAPKGACPVWEGAVGNVPQGNALAAYFTILGMSLYHDSVYIELGTEHIRVGYIELWLHIHNPRAYQLGKYHL